MTKAPERTYTKNGKAYPIGYPDKSDTEMAGTVRMLTRHDLRHEIVCTAARDRILCLVEERDNALALVAAAYEDARNVAITAKSDYAAPTARVDIANAIDARTPDDATAALERVKQEVAEQAAKLADEWYHNSGHGSPGDEIRAALQQDNPEPPEAG